ncbi:MAG TPA: HAMP domain-containing sensor histidine kinase [Acidimicrobiales bacterium]
MSLRARLLVAIGVIALVALLIADLVTYSALQSFLYQRVDQQLSAFHGGYEHAIDQGYTIPCVGAPGQVSPPTRSGAGTGGGPDGGLSNAQQTLAVQVRTTSGTTVGGTGCPTYVDGKAFTPAITTPITGFTTAPDGTQVAFFDAPSAQADGPTFRVRASTLANGDLLILAQPLGDTESTLSRLLMIELLVTAGAVIVALGAGFWLVRLGLKPLRDMETAAESIAEGNLTERVPGESGKTEVGRLARTLNVMLSRIESAFRARVASEERLLESDARLRRFVADASHELRTPIAAISAYAELFGRGASEQKADLERLMGGIQSETGRMEHLVADLLLLARLDEGRPMEMHPVDLVALCGEAVQTSRTVGPGWPVTFTAPRPIEVVGDATSLRQVIDNLLGNVRSHTPEGTTTHVSVAPDGDGAVVVVADDGPGMDPDQVAHVFERFYRSDPSRSRLHGGAGLGLSIVAAIVAAHRGTVTATSVLGQGTTFTVRLSATPSVGLPVPSASEGSLPAPGTAPSAAPPATPPAST